MTLYILNYNNYYNRLVKKFDTIEEYKPYRIHTIEKVNFNPNDGVSTVATPIGNSLNLYDGKGDYVIITENELVNVGTEENPNFQTVEVIKSRWFLIEAVRLKGGQWAVSLQRDLIADYYNIIVDSPCFIEKATLLPSDPFIYNSENMTFNQIKTKEYELRDYSNTAWIVGYMDNNYLKSDSPLEDYQITAKLETAYDMEYDGTLQSFKNEFKIDNSQTTYAIKNDSLRYVVSWLFTNNTLNTFFNLYCGPNFSEVTQGFPGTRENLLRTVSQYGFDENTKYYVSSNPSYDLTPVERTIWNRLIEMADAGEAPGLFYDLYDTFQNEIILYGYFNAIAPSHVSKLYNFNNKIVKFTDGYYKISITNSGVSTLHSYISSSFGDRIAEILDLPLVGGLNQQTCQPNVRVESDKLFIGIRKQNVLENIITELPNPLLKLSDAPYTMFAIPYNKDGTVVSIVDGEDTIEINNNASFGMAQELMKKLQTGSYLYDIQLLPYCPVPRIFEFDSENNFLNMSLNKEIYTTDIGAIAPKSFCRILNQADSSTVSYIFFATQSDFTINLPSISIESENNFKINSQTDIYRLVSPNYNGQFEFNLAKNNGLSYFNIDCTYKPYTPYIHVNPDFGGLYGTDFNDARGLICNGDFSLPQVTDQWRQYEINNKNYQNIFDRQIQNLEINNRIGRERDIYSAISGTITGAIGGVLGAQGSGIEGMIAGGIYGGGKAAMSGGFNYAWNEQLRNEAIDYTKDNFGYQLGNIQALPQSISKTSSLTYNNKIFPILEYYTCTDKEKEALARKIAYNGMTVMRIGTISEFIKNTWSYKNIQSENYIKGQLIRLEGLEDDFHISNAIAGEINKGLFFKEVRNVN